MATDILSCRPTVKGRYTAVQCGRCQMQPRWMGIVAVVLIICPFAAGGASSPSPPLPVSAKSALLADAETGKILWAYQPDLPCYPASVTKMMTAVLILERGNLDDWVTIPKEAAFTGESSMALKEGERVRLRDLLAAIVVRSANDACVAAAIHLAGSVDKFVGWMNEKARELGMTHTHFVNPHGLHHPNHYTTARDLLTLARYALRLPQFRRLVALPEVTIAPTNKSALRHYRNRNKLLTLYPGCDGIKTGYTVPAGKCLVASATRDGWQLIAIVLGSQNHFADCATLLDYGFHSFVRLTLAQAGEPITLFHVPGGDPEWLRGVAAETVRVIVPRQAINRVRCWVQQMVTRPPIQKGQVIGEVVWDIPGASEHRVRVVALRAMDWSLEAKVHMVGERLLLAFFVGTTLAALGRWWHKRRRRP
ncbi:D-alanyl-D-alanine carboxypeptidase DacB [bacterium HR17]|uniref:D-alanyl-D-alanine carboxypeptidase DacB n=1 Tax=Candidatus Fervidibacter japonicus TaxID=2035412 RepID=A0A2H5XAA7_9BACT|nr:D-alanyl-D-alanine carboxypeptidase DacB [bacterium HR17]